MPVDTTKQNDATQPDENDDVTDREATLLTAGLNSSHENLTRRINQIREVYKLAQQLTENPREGITLLVDALRFLALITRNKDVGAQEVLQVVSKMLALPVDPEVLKTIEAVFFNETRSV